MHDAGPDAASQQEAHPPKQRFVFPCADWAASADAELRHLGYVTDLRRREDDAWVLEVTGSAPMMLAFRQAVEDDETANQATPFPCWVTWNADPDVDETPTVRRLATATGLAAVVDAAARREQALARLEASLHI